MRERNATLTNNSLHANSATDGGALFLDGLVNTDTARLYNNTFWDNDADQGADLWIDNDADMDFIPAPVTLRYNDFDQTFDAGYWSTLPLTIDGTNLDAVDPRFADALLHLSAASPLIDAGDSNAPELPATDMDGEARIMGVRVEIGADEYDDGVTRYRLTVQPSGQGEVTGRDGQIDCGSACLANYLPGTQVIMDADQSVSATFEPCPFGQVVAAEGASSGWIDLAYAVRDEVLPRVAYGDWMVRAYYRHAVEVSGRLLIDRSLRKQALVLFKQLEPSLRNAVAGGEPQVTPAARGAIERFVAALSRGASPALKGDLDAFLSRF